MKKYDFLSLVFMLISISAFSQQSSSPPIVDEVECIDGLQIQKFKLKEFPDLIAPRLDWKIVTNLPIEYKSKGGDSGSIIWNWQLGTNELSGISSDFWSLEPINNTFKHKSKNDYWTETSLSPLPEKNNKFGENKGELYVSDGVISNDPNETNKIKVFYQKNAKESPNPDVENWFHYWEDAGRDVNLFKTIGMPFFTVDPNTNEASLQPNSGQVEFDANYREDGVWAWNELDPAAGGSWTYGNTSAGQGWRDQAEMTLIVNSDACSESVGFRKVMTGYGNIDFSMNIGQSNGYEVRSHTYDESTGEETGDIIYKGIEGFVATVLHELKHWELKVELWIGTGYDTADDCDGDGYPDSWEAGPIGMQYGFNPQEKDIYNFNYAQEETLEAAGAAAWYEEVRCRICEFNGPRHILNDKDWSFDISNQFQGKNWKE